MRNLAVINVPNLIRNAKEIKKRLNPGVKFCAVVKADAYGHGAETVANALYGIVDCYAVALVEEGVALRQAGIRKDILVLIPPFNSDLEVAVRYNLTLTVDSIDKAKSIAREAKRQDARIKIHVKYNTGMNRQGVDSLDGLDEICRYVSKEKHLVLDGVFSHFSAPENKKSRNRALDKFLLAINRVKSYNDKVIFHISASGGFLVGEQFDMVRIGIMLYGYTPFKTDKICLKPVMKITSPVICDRLLKRGETAGYGDVRVKKGGRYSLVRYGYADGLFRRNVHAQHGNRCMDLTLVKSGKSRKSITVLDDAERTAENYGTISYEVLCKAPMRAERVYRR